MSRAVPHAEDIHPYGQVRLTFRLLRYWEQIRGARAMPQENDIDPEVLGEDWNYCFLLQSRDIANIQDYNFTYLGSKILQAYCDEAIDAHNDCMVGPNAFRLSAHFSKLLEIKAPLIDEGEFETIHGHRVLYRQILLPLGSSADVVEAIFGGMSYKIVD